MLRARDLCGGRLVTGVPTAKHRRHSSVTRQGWSSGIGGCDAAMKRRVSSSGCKTRPAKGEPARAGSEPCSGHGDGAGDA